QFPLNATDSPDGCVLVPILFATFFPAAINASFYIYILFLHDALPIFYDYRFEATDMAGNTASGERYLVDLPALDAAPDLLAADDHGLSIQDNVTNLAAARYQISGHDLVIGDSAPMPSLQTILLFDGST